MRDFPSRWFKVLSFKEALNAYASIKSTSNKENLASCLSRKEVNPLYEMTPGLNRIETLTRLSKISSSMILLSGTWNSWLLNVFTDDPSPFFTHISNYDYVSRNELLKLKYLILYNKWKVQDDIYVDKTENFVPLTTKFSNTQLI